jgi:hypothetical protein
VGWDRSFGCDWNFVNCMEADSPLQSLFNLSVAGIGNKGKLSYNASERSDQWSEEVGLGGLLRG